MQKAQCIAKQLLTGSRTADHLDTRVWGRPQQHELPPTVQRAPQRVFDKLDACSKAVKGAGQWTACSASAEEKMHISHRFAGQRFTDVRG